MSDALIGSLFDGRYHVLRKLGAGGMANVYLAEDQELGRRVAIKILNDRHANDEQFVERFRREAKNAAGLSHPSIVSIYDRGEAEGTYYIAMEYLEGRSLKELIVSRGPAPVNVAIEYARQILQALRFAHLKGIVHRDIKPHNVLVDGDGRLKVTDFGIARAGTSQMTEAGSIVGTAQYLSPEQARGAAVDQRSDVYSLGIVLYELLTGDVPFSGDTPVEIAMKHLSQTPEPPSALRSEVPHDLDLVVMRALAKDPEDRYQSAEEMEADLARVARGAGVSPETEESATQIMRAPTGPMAATAATMITRPQRGVPPPAPPGTYYDYEEPIHQRPVWPWIAALLFVVAAAIGGWFIYHQISHQLASNAVAPVSNYEGLRKELAVSKVHSDGFKVTIDFQANPTAPADFVFAQDPSPGTRQPKGNTVTITVSTGLPKVAVPALVGLQSTDAVAALANAKLKWVIKEVNSNKPAGEVTGQDPKKAKQVVQGTTVRFNVSKGPTPVPIPSVVGEAIQAATSTLQGSGFQVRPTYVDSSQPANQVIQQTPKAGGTAAKGSVVAITVSKGPKTTTVPFVQSEDVGTATTDLQSSGFKVHIVNEPTTDPNQDGIVLSQTPAGGAQVKPGSTVTITVGRITNSTTTTPTTTTP
ncbi:MAG TPA: Stk1 family PASTA domain-containing Ser/Thr kinase [Gaiellaceae bacterium]|nr:Stk1 family PASTA domain-containing Ser/Thr kinase [Gaiellaceae bacterium]